MFRLPACLRHAKPKNTLARSDIPHLGRAGGIAYDVYRRQERQTAERQHRRLVSEVHEAMHVAAGFREAARNAKGQAVVEKFGKAREQAQRALAETSRRMGICIQVFHGRGGAIIEAFIRNEQTQRGQIIIILPKLRQLRRVRHRLIPFPISLRDGFCWFRCRGC